MSRKDGRSVDQIRPVKITRNYLDFAEGSVLIEMGKTKVLCAASVQDGVPPWMNTGDRGWVTAEYAMLPKATKSRTTRESSRGKVGGRTHEIQRLIGRSLRSIVDLEKLGPRTIWLDCDVIQADGGTRTAAISGAAVALYDALRFLCDHKVISDFPMSGLLAATSVGLVKGELLLDLAYNEDHAARVDFNVVMTEAGEFVELQGTAEGKPFSGDALQKMLVLAEKGIGDILAAQKEALGIE